MAKLTKAQRDLLLLLSTGARTDITDELVVGSLVDRGLVLKFHESTGFASMTPVWAITDAGRRALSPQPEATK